MVTKKHKKEEEVEVTVPVVPENAEETPEPTPKTHKGAVTRVVFHLNDVVVKQREFSEAVHGADFLSIADSFAESNARRIRSREDLP